MLVLFFFLHNSTVASIHVIDMPCRSEEKMVYDKLWMSVFLLGLVNVFINIIESFSDIIKNNVIKLKIIISLYIVIYGD